MAKFRTNRLNGLFPLSYTGVIPVSPVNFVQDDSAPTPHDSRNFYIGDMWLNIASDVAPSFTAPTINDLYILVSQDKGIGTWISFGSGGSTLTLTGNTGGPVPPTAGNINVIGDTSVGITVTGNPGTSTLTITSTGVIANHFTANTGTATPSAGNLNIFGNSGVITTTASGSTVTVDLTTATDGQVIIGSSIGNPAWSTLIAGANITITNGHNSITIAGSGGGTGILTITGNTGGAVGPDGSNNINFVGASLISVAGNPGTNTLTINASGAIASQFTANSGTAVPSAGNLNIFGNSGVLTTVASGSTVTVDLTAATDGQVIIGSSIGNPAWNTLTAGSGITITNGHNSISIAATGSGGSGNANSFSYFLGAIAAHVTGDGTNYPLGAGLAGASAIFTLGGGSGPGYDNTSGAIFPGDGGSNPFTFTTPSTGNYYFRVTAFMTGFTSSHTEGQFQFLQIRGISTFVYTGWAINPGVVFTSLGGLGQSICFTADATFHCIAGDVIEWNLIITGAGKVINMISNSGTGFQGTWVSGWQVS